MRDKLCFVQIVEKSCVTAFDSADTVVLPLIRVMQNHQAPPDAAGTQFPFPENALRLTGGTGIRKTFHPEDSLPAEITARKNQEKD